MTGLRLLQSDTPEGLDTVVTASEVDIDDLSPLLLRHIFNHRRTDDAGIVDQPIQGAKTLDGAVERYLDKVSVTDTAGAGQHPLGGIIAGSHLQSVLLQVNQHHRGTQVIGQIRNRLANTLSSSSNNDGFTSQTHGINHERSYTWVDITHRVLTKAGGTDR